MHYVIAPFERKHSGENSIVLFFHTRFYTVHIVINFISSELALIKKMNLMACIICQSVNHLFNLVAVQYNDEHHFIH